MKLRLVPAVLASAIAVAVLAGCGDSGESELAGLAPPGSVVFAEADLRPSGELKEGVEAATRKIAGVDDLGGLIVDEIESSSRDDGDPVDFQRDVEPWLGERAAVVFERLEDGDLSDPIALLGTSDAAAAETFIAKREGKSDEVAALVDDVVVVAPDRGALKAIEDAAEGDSLAGEERFETSFSEAPDDSLVDVYVDVAALLEQGDVDIDEQVRIGLGEGGVELEDAAALLSLVPSAEQVEIEIRSDATEGVSGEEGEAPELLGSLPRNAFAALAISGFGERLKEVVDSIDKEGIPDSVPPGQLKSGLKEAGIEIDQVLGSLRDAGAFAVGNSESSLGGALVLTADGNRAANTVANLGSLVRAAGAPGVTALRGDTNGFSIRSDDLGDKPLVVAARGERIAIGYGLPPTLRALASGDREATLADNPAYEKAVEALGDTPIFGFADGPAALRLAESLVPRSEQGFRKARRYLRAISFLALGSSSGEDPAVAKLIAGLE